VGGHASDDSASAKPRCLLGRRCRHDCGMDLTGDGHVHTEWSYDTGGPVDQRPIPDEQPVLR
jgi:hypothetical protein